MLGIVGAASCTVYDQKLLDEAKGVGGATGSGASGGDAASGGSGGGDGGSSVSGGSAGSATGGTSGGSSGGSAGSSGGSGGASGKGGSSGSSTGGKAGTGAGGTSAGKGGGGTPGAGTAGTVSEGGEGGEVTDPCPGGDCCPTDDNKTMPGVCGCDMPETDSDGDMTPDCMDACDDDDARTVPGACGCDSPYADADCAALSTALVHRYSFNGTGAVIEDSAGTADGTLTQQAGGTAAQSGGVVTLPGGVAPANDANKAYVALPTGTCLAGLTDATFEAWVTWSQTCAPSGCTNSLNWQRVFDFGTTSTGTSGSNIFLTPRSSNTGNTVFSASTTTGANNELTTGYRTDNASIMAGMHHFALVVDDTGNQVRLYIDGTLAVPVVAANNGTYAGTLASVTATNCWLGRSNYASDAYFNGSFDEFRIYDTALTKALIDVSIDAGPNADFL